MPTTKTRINISLPKDIETILDKLAKRDDVPKATKALQLIKLAMEIEEDELWDRMVSERDKKNAKFLSHKKAWA